MSTFYGGEQLVNVVNLKGRADGNLTIYTVPSGRYAKVYIYKNRKIIQGSFPADNYLFVGNGTSDVLAVRLEANATQFVGTHEAVNPYILVSGQTVIADVNQDGPTEYFISVQEYLTP